MKPCLRVLTDYVDIKLLFPEMNTSSPFPDLCPLSLIGSPEKAMEFEETTKFRFAQTR